VRPYGNRNGHNLVDWPKSNSLVRLRLACRWHWSDHSFDALDLMQINGGYREDEKV
jgi:hypothetical protein